MRGRTAAAAALCAWTWSASCDGLAAQEFGQNHVIIRDFDWRSRETEHFDLYYYEGSKPRLWEAAEILETAFRRVSASLGIETEPPVWATEGQKKRLKWRRRPFFLYANPNDFQQSNIALVGDGTGGVTEPFKDRFMAYNDGTRQWLEEVSTHEFVHIMQFHVLVSGFWKSGRILKTIVYPLWFIEGMPGYLTYGIESALEEVTIRDAATSGGLLSLVKLEHFGHLKPHQVTLAYKQGAAAMEFLAEQFGARKVGEMLRLFESRFDTGQVLSELIGLDAFEFDRKYREFLETKYRRLVRSERLAEPQAYGGALTRTPDAIPQFNTAPVLSPDYRRLYYLTTSAGHPAAIRELDLRNGRIRTLPGVGRAPIENVMLGNFANLSRVLALSRDGRRLLFAGTKNHRDSLFLYDLEEGRLDRRELPGFMTVAQPQFSPDGLKVVFSGMKDTFTDLYLYDLASGILERLTEDPQDDEMPVFTPDGSAVVYSSEVEDPRSPRRHERRLYRLDLKERTLTRLEDSGGSARDPVVSADGSKVLFILADSAHSEVCELDLAAGKVTRLTRSIGGSFTPAYAAPDGSEIVFAGLRRGNVHLYKGARPDFLSEEVPPVSVGIHGPARVPGPSVAEAPASTAPALSAERPYRFTYSTDLFIPAFFYSSVGGFFWTSYYQGSDLLGNHQSSLFLSLHSGQSFDYAARYAYLRRRPEFVFGADGSARTDLVDINTNHAVTDAYHSQFAAVRYPLDRYHRVEAVVRSVSERIHDTTLGVNDAREARLGGLSLVRDTTTGRYLVATRGNRLRFSYSQAAQALGGSRRYYVAAAEGHQFVPLGGQNALAFRAVALQSLGRDHPQLILGGLGGVRGYARSLSQDFGDRLGVVNAELRFPLFKDLDYHMWYLFPDFYFKAVFATLFTDVGYAWNSEGELSRARWGSLRNSVGLGLRIYTFILQEFPLVISMDYAHRTTQNGGIFYVYLGQVF